jgi:hypothetical protein
VLVRMVIVVGRSDTATDPNGLAIGIRLASVVDRSSTGESPRGRPRKVRIPFYPADFNRTGLIGRQ